MVLRRCVGIPNAESQNSHIKYFFRDKKIKGPNHKNTLPVVNTNFKSANKAILTFSGIRRILLGLGEQIGCVRVRRSGESIHADQPPEWHTVRQNPRSFACRWRNMPQKIRKSSLVLTCTRFNEDVHLGEIVSISHRAVVSTGGGWPGATAGLKVAGTTCEQIKTGKINRNALDSRNTRVEGVQIAPQIKAEKHNVQIWIFVVKTGCCFRRK